MKYDVVVIGGGIAGVSAALSASRQNKTVLLVEKSINLGGLATSGLVTIYLPICDGEGHQVSFGIAEELLHLSIKMGSQRKYPKAWLENGTFEEKKQKRFEVQFNPVYFSLLMENLLIKNNVDITYETMVTDVVIKNNVLEKVIAESVEGKIQIVGDSYVDASGDARLFYLSNDDTRLFEKGNILAAWYYYMNDKGLNLNMLGTVEKSDFMDETRHTDELLSNVHYKSENYLDINKFIIDSHQIMLTDIEDRKKKDASFEATLIPSMPQLRKIRSLVGKTIFKQDDQVYKENSIGIISDWRRRGYVYEVPFSCLCSKTIKNVFAAGRCVSVDDEMWEITRAIPSCAITGEAAGIAASIFAEKGLIDFSDLYDRLKKVGQKLHISSLNIERR